MTLTSRLRLAALVAPPAVIVLLATVWLWLRFGMSVWFDAAAGALAGCL